MAQTNTSNTNDANMNQSLGNTETPVIKDCYYFLTTGCLKGDTCPFRHNPEVKKVNMICSKFLKGGCHDPNCQFIHLPSLPTAPHHPHRPVDHHASNPSERKECKYFKQGRCKNGDKCPYLHSSQDSAALTQQLAALVALVQNQVTVPQSSNTSQKRSYKTEAPSKRLQVMGVDGSDPLGYAPPASMTSRQQLQEKANRMKHQINKMVEGHLTRQGKRKSILTPASTPAPSVNDFVVRTRAEILAEKEAKEKASLQDSSKVCPPPSVEDAVTTTATPATIPETSSGVQDVVPEPDEASFDEGDVDDSDFRDELAEIDRVMGSTQ